MGSAWRVGGAVGTLVLVLCGCGGGAHQTGSGAHPPAGTHSTTVAPDPTTAFLNQLTPLAQQLGGIQRDAARAIGRAPTTPDPRAAPTFQRLADQERASVRALSDLIAPRQFAPGTQALTIAYADNAVDLQTIADAYRTRNRRALLAAFRAEADGPDRIRAASRLAEREIRASIGSKVPATP
jgi:hypothetical protein